MHALDKRQSVDGVEAPKKLRAAGPGAGEGRKRRPKTPELPVSRFAPLKFERPLSLFPSLPVHLSSPLTFSPDTVMRVVADISLQELLRSKVPPVHALFRKLSYVARGRHQLSPGLRNLALSELSFVSFVLPRAEVERSLDDPKHQPSSPRSDWELALRGLQSGGDERTDDILGLACHWMTACDAHGNYAHDLVLAGKTQEAEARLRELLSPSHEAWKRLNPNLAMYALAPLDVSLMALARLEWQTANMERGEAPAESMLTSLLEPGARPAGHWLREVSERSDCANLGALSRALFCKHARYREDVVSHARLQKWARSKEVVMPPQALEPVLMALQAPHDREALENRFYAARFLTFLCDLVRSATLRTAPGWDEVQEQVERRYAEAYRRQAASAN